MLKIVFFEATTDKPKAEDYVWHGGGGGGGLGEEEMITQLMCTMGKQTTEPTTTTKTKTMTRRRN